MKYINDLIDNANQNYFDYPFRSFYRFDHSYHNNDKQLICIKINQLNNFILIDYQNLNRLVVSQKFMTNKNHDDFYEINYISIWDDQFNCKYHLKNELFIAKIWIDESILNFISHQNSIVNYVIFEHNYLDFKNSTYTIHYPALLKFIKF